MLHLVKHVEKWFWAFCVGAVLVGLLLPPAKLLVWYPWTADVHDPNNLPLFKYGWTTKVFLGGILFFTGLKIDFRTAFRELSRPWFLLYVSVMVMVVLPLGLWGLAKWLLPGFALGILIVAAMPAGLAGSSLTDICKGNTGLALIVTMVTSAVCPLVTPLVVRVGTGGAGEAGWLLMGQQALMLALLLFLPLAAAALVRRVFPALVERHREGLTGLSILSLSLLIISIMASVSDQFKDLVRRDPWSAVWLILFMAFFSASMHLAGYFLAPWRPVRDRAALSVNTAYVNNGLGMVFATTFFANQSEAVLPAIFLEIPMVLAILPLRAWVARATRSDAPGDAGPAAPPPAEGR
ncbi:MAG TPA: bile acid:sodium symporter [Planctomycetota bacterium]|nr:bile acid:sodium symporter [Planctomycetota bacterium]